MTVVLLVLAMLQPTGNGSIFADGFEHGFITWSSSTAPSPYACPCTQVSVDRWPLGPSIHLHRQRLRPLVCPSWLAGSLLPVQINHPYGLSKHLYTAYWQETCQ